MKINRKLLLDLRKEKSWSQDELAVAAGLNLRTVQRIETSGSASLQSRKALAAAFNMDVREFDSLEAPMKTDYEYRVVRFDLTWSAMGKLKTDFVSMEKELNSLGADGWDLVKISELYSAGMCTAALVATLKRSAE